MFKVGDPVVWCGCEGEVVHVVDNDENDLFPIEVEFDDYLFKSYWFTKDGKAITWHKEPSLFKVEDK